MGRIQGAVIVVVERPIESGPEGHTGNAKSSAGGRRVWGVPPEREWEELVSGPQMGGRHVQSANRRRSFAVAPTGSFSDVLSFLSVMA